MSLNYRKPKWLISNTLIKYDYKKLRFVSKPSHETTHFAFWAFIISKFKDWLRFFQHNTEISIAYELIIGLFSKFLLGLWFSAEFSSRFWRHTPRLPLAIRGSRDVSLYSHWPILHLTVEVWEKESFLGVQIKTYSSPLVQTFSGTEG